MRAVKMITCLLKERPIMREKNSRISCTERGLVCIVSPRGVRLFLINRVHNSTYLMVAINDVYMSVYDRSS